MWRDDTPNSVIARRMLRRQHVDPDHPVPLDVLFTHHLSVGTDHVAGA